MTRVLLTIAGSDSGGGAGLQADLRAFWDHGWHGASVVTAVTAQHTAGVTRIDAVPVEGVRAQLDAVLGDLDVAAIKLGMLGSADVARAVADVLEALPTRPPIVVDPVLVATSGHRLSADDVVEVYRTRLAPLATVLTPNQPEAAVLGAVDAAALRARLGAPVLVTGGDADGDDVVDVLSTPADDHVWRQPRLPGGPFHGTGCTLASAVAARLADGDALPAATEAAIAYVRRRLATARRIGRGAAVLGPSGAPGVTAPR